MNRTTEGATKRHTASAPREQGRLRVVVAMSGGVDSSVVAALMKDAGHEVIGITLQLYDHGAAMARKSACCAGQDIHDARRVAEMIDIPHYVLDYESRFSEAVIEEFADSYVAGETPIPCVRCNQEIKFKDLLATAEELGADYLATGHYIARRDGPEGTELIRAHDGDRDQSYFMFATTRAQLAKLWFPLGDMPKDEVRRIAEERGLPVASKPDSQDICFVPNGRYTDIVAKLRPDALKPGPIVHVDGTHLGDHEGIIHFTIGQRRGLGIAKGAPLYVVKLDAATNSVVVGPRDSLETRTLILRDVNWLGVGPIEAAAGDGLAIHARVRSTQPPEPAMLHVDLDGTVRVELRNGDGGVARGQACVFYDGEGDRARILGGGWISDTVSAADADLLPAGNMRTAVHAVD